MNLDFLYFALAAGLGIAAVAGPLGSLMVWQRMAYFGDTLAHGALLGVAMGLWFSFSNDLAVLLTCLILAATLIGLQELHLLATDTLLGILSHTALALGLVAIALIPNARVNMEGLLFGDLLAITRTELISIWLMAAVVLLLLWRLWDSLVAVTVHEDLAEVEGIPVLQGWFVWVPGLVWMLLKVCFFLFVYLWLRATFPRYRYDQLMRLGWKVLIPTTIVWIMVAVLLVKFNIGPWFN